MFLLDVILSSRNVSGKATWLSNVQTSGHAGCGQQRNHWRGRGACDPKVNRDTERRPWPGNFRAPGQFESIQFTDKSDFFTYYEVFYSVSVIALNIAKIVNSAISSISFPPPPQQPQHVKAAPMIYFDVSLRYGPPLEYFFVFPSGSFGSVVACLC